MGISFKALAKAAATKVLTDLSDETPDTAMVATAEAKGIEALETLKAEAATEAKAFAKTPEGVRKLLIAKRAGQARLAVASLIGDMTGRVSTVQARRGADISEGRGASKRALTAPTIASELTKLLQQPGALKESIEVYNPSRKGAKAAPAPLLACRLLHDTLAAAQALVDARATRTQANAA